MSKRRRYFDSEWFISFATVILATIAALMLVRLIFIGPFFS